MANKNENNATTEKKMTKYDLKMQRRKEQELHDKKMLKLTKGIFAAIVAIIVIIIGVNVYDVCMDRYGDYVSVGDHKVKRDEFQFHYNFAKTNFINSYGSYLSYFGLDENADMDNQPYSEDMTWGDYFKQQAAQQIQEMYALNDAADKEEGYSYDSTESITGLVSSLEAASEQEGKNIDALVKEYYGEDATLELVKKWYGEYDESMAYYQHVLEGFEVTDQDIETYYSENKDNYDAVTYHLYTVNAEVAETEEGDEDAAQKAKEEAMAEAKKAAEEFKNQVSDEASFEKLYEEAVSAEETTDETVGEAEEKDESLKTANGYASTSPDVVAQWLYDGERKAGDLSVLEGDNAYYVVYFVGRERSATASEDIDNVLRNEQMSEYMATLLESYEVKDIRAGLVYLTQEEESEQLEESAQTE